MSIIQKNKTSREAPGITTASLPDIVFMLLCFFIVITKMRETDVKVITKIPQISELQKIENRGLNQFVFIGPPTRQYAGEGMAPKLQLNDAFAKPKDILLWSQGIIGSCQPSQYAKITISMKVDKGVKMGLVNETKAELRKANLRQIYYLANKAI